MQFGLVPGKHDPVRSLGQAFGIASGKVNGLLLVDMASTFLHVEASRQKNGRFAKKPHQSIHLGFIKSIVSPHLDS